MTPRQRRLYLAGWAAALVAGLLLGWAVHDLTHRPALAPAYHATEVPA